MDWHVSARTFRRCARKSRQQPVLYTNFLLRCFVHSVAVCLRNSLMITSLALDGIPLASKYLRILSDGLINNRNLRSLSLARCRIGDAGCDILLESLQRNSSLYTLNLSSCCLTNRSATCLSLFFKKVRADLLQNVWKESTLSRDVRPAMEGLRILILDRNYKFSDIGLRHLIRVLKNDFWLKTLCLRYCGITQQGEEIVLELLKINSVLTHIDLRNNEVSSDVLQTIRKILKRRKSNGEIISMKKRLLSCRHIFVRNMISESTKNKFSKNQTNRCARKMKRSKNRKYKSCNIIKRSHVKCINVDRLKKHLSFMIKRNQNLVTILKDRTNFLMKEKNRRFKAEEVYHKIQPRLINLRNKIAIQNSIHLNMRYENQVYTNLQNMFNDLKISTKEKVKDR